eukprot:CAMPEP_0172749108 /NCGR_PEP_ID=MMETSP1074-20121228/146538_1 /TAXON_ID=2916 /ORGANISM="Ceratium fusus, Strain PA161109" /LENGTH=336 /DNA_ID=CAMNT_0013580983 /DNA_START=42 /DNA_END=1052 /DNA_ORIENTATION=+
MSGTIQVVDLQWVGTTRESELLQAWDEAFKTSGFLLLKGHGMQSLFEDMEREVRDFFCCQPHDEKMKFSLGRGYGFGGYVQQGILAVARGSEIHKARPPDAVETLESLTQGCTVLPGVDNGYASNALRDQASHLYAQLQEVLVKTCMELSAKSLQMSTDFFESAGGWGKNYRESFGRLRFTRYLPSIQDEQLQYGEHTDTSMFTFIWRSQRNGLQCRDPSDYSKWIEVDWDPDLLVVNAGDTASLLTNGRWRSNVHRVIGPNADALRHSSPITIAYFAQPSDDTLLRRLPSPSVPQCARYDSDFVVPSEDVTAKGYRQWKVGNMKMGRKRKLESAL